MKIKSTGSSLLLMVLGYLLVLIGIGVYSTRKKIQNSEDCLVAGRRLGSFLIAGTLDMVGGWGMVVETLPGKSLSITDSIGWPTIFSLIFIYNASFICGQVVTLRLYAAKNSKKPFISTMVPAPGATNRLQILPSLRHHDCSFDKESS